MFNLGGLATLFHALAIANILIAPTTASPSDSEVVSARAAALWQRSVNARADNASLVARADCSRKPTYDAPPITDQEFAPYNEDEATFYRYRQQQSVNLGSWFMHESWMTRGPYECAAGSKGAEIDIAHGWGGISGARAVLEKHWDTFIKEDDLKYLAGVGINTVRLPIGFFHLGPDFTKGTPFESVGDVYKNSWPRIVRLINQAAKYKIGVLVDLHGAAGSQNGNDHSGVSDKKVNLFSNKGYQDNTVEVLKFLTRQLVKVNNVVGVQILNEPKNVPELVPFYNRAIDAMRGTSEEAKNFPLYIHDGFDLNKFSNYVAGRKDFVVQDHHSYFVFNPSDKTKPAADTIHNVQNGVRSSLQNASNKQHRNLVVDEWSCAVNNANGGQAKDFCTSQLKAYSETTAGWSFWAYNKDGCDAGWCFRAAVGNTLPSTFFSYSGSNGKVPDNVASSATVKVSVNEHNDTPSPSPSATNSASSTSSSPSSTPSPSPSPSTHTCKSKKARALNKLQQRSQHARLALEKRAPGAYEQGQTDGKQTAKNFAAFNMSKLGFTRQFILDKTSNKGDDYANGFLQGLKDGEAEVQKAL